MDYNNLRLPEMFIENSDTRKNCIHFLWSSDVSRFDVIFYHNGDTEIEGKLSKDETHERLKLNNNVNDMINKFTHMIINFLHLEKILILKHDFNKLMQK